MFVSDDVFVTPDTAVCCCSNDCSCGCSDTPQSGINEDEAASLVVPVVAVVVIRSPEVVGVVHDAEKWMATPTPSVTAVVVAASTWPSASYACARSSCSAYTRAKSSGSVDVVADAVAEDVAGALPGVAMKEELC